MRNFIETKLVYVEDGKNKDDIEHTKIVRAMSSNPTENRVYKNLELGFETNNILYIKEHYALDYNNGELTYIELNDVRYKINTIIPIRGGYVYLNIGEQL